MIDTVIAVVLRLAWALYTIAHNIAAPPAPPEFADPAIGACVERHRATLEHHGFPRNSEDFFATRKCTEDPNAFDPWDNRR
jgi:hypothetical protein